MSGYVDIPGAFQRQRVKELDGIVVVVDAVDIDVVDIQQQLAIAFFQNSPDKR